MEAKYSFILLEIGVNYVEIKECFYYFLCYIYCIVIRMFERKKTFSLTNGENYFFSEYKPEYNLKIQGVNITNATFSEIAKIESDDIDKPDNDVGPIQHSKQAAIYGTEILNSFYDDWTYDNYVMVGYNSNANVWFVHGQVKDRYHYNDKVGQVIFDAKTGKVIYINFTEPQSGDGNQTTQNIGDGTLC